LWRRTQAEAQLEKELAFHLAAHTDDLVAQGYEPAEARRQARLAFGGVEQAKEDVRGLRPTRWLEDMLHDVRYAVRVLLQKPGFTAVTLLTLALGTGATTVMFTEVNGVLLKPMPYPQPDKLVVLQERTEKATFIGNLWAFAYPNYLDLKREAQSVADLAAFRYGGGTVKAGTVAEYVEGIETSANMFQVLGVSVAQGRSFLPQEDQHGADPVAIIGGGLARRLFGSERAAIGMPLTFEGERYSVIGIAPAGFHISGLEPEVFRPLGQDAGAFMQNRGRHPGIAVWARLRPGVTLEQARAKFDVIAHQLAAQYPDTNAGRSFTTDPLRPDVGDVSSSLWLLLGAVSLVLLIACVNVASLLLARAISRQREFAIRLALGAARGRVVRQCLTESAVLAVAGGLFGLMLAMFGLRPFVTFWPGALPRAEEVHLDAHVLLFALAVSIFCGLLFGLAPALRVPPRGLEQALRAGARSIAGSSRRLHTVFVVSEIAVAVVLLVSAGMLGRTLLRLVSVDPGVNLHNVLIARMELPPSTLADTGRTRAAWQDVLERARAVPGVQSVALVDTVPMREGNNQIPYWTTPTQPAPDRAPYALATSVTPDYLHTMGLRLRKGRFFTDADRLGSQSVVVIDDVMAQQAFGGDDPIGKHVWIGLGADPATVVGVVAHVRHWGAAGDDQAKVRAQIYYPFAQVPDQYVKRWSELMSIAVKTRVPPLTVVAPLRRAVRGATGDQVLYQVRTMEELAKASLARQRFLLVLFAIFAALALLLACVGVYGVLAYLTNERVPEIAIRMALGASGQRVIKLIMRQSVVMVGVGVILGTVAALGAERVLEHGVEGVRSGDPSTFAVMIAVLVAAALGASFVPALRASRVDPMQALRQE
jgi:predicted permease